MILIEDIWKKNAVRLEVKQSFPLTICIRNIFVQEFSVFKESFSSLNPLKLGGIY